MTIEEVYELGDAILDNDLVEVKNELGDLLLHIVFYPRSVLKPTILILPQSVIVSVIN